MISPRWRMPGLSSRRGRAMESSIRVRDAVSAGSHRQRLAPALDQRRRRVRRHDVPPVCSATPPRPRCSRSQQADRRRSPSRVEGPATARYDPQVARRTHAGHRRDLERVLSRRAPRFRGSRRWRRRARGEAAALSDAVGSVRQRDRLPAGQHPRRGRDPAPRDRALRRSPGGWPTASRSIRFPGAETIVGADAEELRGLGL